MSTPFRSRNPVIIGAVSLLVIAMMIAIAFKADSLPLIGGGTTYYAKFTEVGGLKVDDPVRVAGVRVGKVNSIELDGDAVQVAFKVKGAPPFGNATGAAIKVQTILGQMYLEVDPGGTGSISGGSVLPGPSVPPFNVVDAFSGLADTAGSIDTTQMAKALTTLADLQRTTPESFRGALTGISALSKVVSAKDVELGKLLKSLDKVTGTLDKRDGDIIALMKDSSTLFQALVARRAAIHNLLVSTSQLSVALQSLIDKSAVNLKPTLDQVNQVLAVFTKNQSNLDTALRVGAPFYRDFANLLGAGPWFDMFIYNMPPAPRIGTVP